MTSSIQTHTHTYHLLLTSDPTRHNHSYSLLEQALVFLQTVNSNQSLQTAANSTYKMLSPVNKPVVGLAKTVSSFFKFTPLNQSKNLG